MTTTSTRPAAPTPATRTTPLYSALIGLASLAILLQGLWAGLFIRKQGDGGEQWVSVHAHGGEVALVLAVAATVLAYVRMRHRRDLVVGTAALVVLLVVESYLGGEIGKHSGYAAVHVPLAMALMGLAVWLPFRASRTA